MCHWYYPIFQNKKQRPKELEKLAPSLNKKVYGRGFKLKSRKSQTHALCLPRSHREIYPFFKKKTKKQVVYLAGSDLSCSTQDLCLARGIFPCPTRASPVWHMGLVAQGMWDLSSPTRDQACIPCIGRWILNPWTTREAGNLPLLLGPEGQEPAACCLQKYPHSPLHPWPPDQ